MADCLGREVVHPWIGPGWFVAFCAQCPQPQPFRDQSLRDAWAVEHVAATGHEVARAKGAHGECL